MFWQCRCNGVDRNVHGGLGSAVYSEVESDNDEEVELVVEYEADFENINSVDKGINDEINVKIDVSVDWGFKYGVRAKVGISVDWDVGKVVGGKVGSDVGCELDRDLPFGSLWVVYFNKLFLSLNIEIELADNKHLIYV